MKTISKMFLIATLVLLIAGLSFTSAADTNSTEVSADDTAVAAVNEPTTAVATANSGIESEGDIDEGSTSTIVEPINAVAGEEFNFTANVARNIPGLRISEGQVQFTTEGVLPANVKADVIDGVATVTYTAPEEWVGKTIPYTAKYLGTDTFDASDDSSTITVVREQFGTNTTMSRVVAEINKPVTLTANVIMALGDPVPEGKVYFTTITGIITDDSSSIIYADVVDGVATTTTTAKESWKDEGDVSTIHATYVGTPDFLTSESMPVALDLYDKVYNTTTTMEKVQATEIGQPINFTAKVDIGDEEKVAPVENGFVQFVINDNIDIVDEDGNIVYANVINGVATVSTVAQPSWTEYEEDPKVKAVYRGVGQYADSTSDEVPLNVYEQLYETITETHSVRGIIGEPVTLTAEVTYQDYYDLTKPVNAGTVYFVINDKAVIMDPEHPGQELLLAVVNGTTTGSVIADESWLIDAENTIKAVYKGDEGFLDSQSPEEALSLYPYFINTTTTMDPVYGVFGKDVTLTAHVVDEGGSPVDVGTVCFLINGKTYVPDVDHQQDILYVAVQNGVASVDVTADKSWDTDYDLLLIQALYIGDEVYNDSISDYVGMYINDSTPSPAPHKQVAPKLVKEVKTVSKVSNDKTYTVLSNNKVITTANVITLGDINNIFTKDFTNGILLVYIDGKLVFNGTTTDDLSLIIIHIIESLVGEHELKVEFTDSNNQTHTYTQNITIK